MLAVVFNCQVSHSETFNNEALFQRAFDSSAFVLHVVKNNPKFLKELSPKEHHTLINLQPIVEKITTYNWLKKNKFHEYADQSQKTFYHVTSKNQVRSVSFPLNFGVNLRFSDQIQVFDLKDGSPTRTAVTTDSLSDDILINRKKINQKGSLLTLGDAFALILHEFGHKLGDQKDQNAVDSLASKIKNFIEQNTTRFQFPSGQVQIFKLKNAPFDPWAEAISYGLYQGVNIPFTFANFSAYHQEGVWVLIENQSSVQDATSLIFKHIDPIVDYVSDPGYNWATMSWYLANEVQVVEKAPSQFSIELNMNHLQFVVPFVKPDSPHPQTVNLYENLFRMQSFTGDFISQSTVIENKGSQLKVLSQNPKPHRFQDPTIEVQTLPFLWRNQDLVFQYQIKGQHRNPIQENNGIPLRAMLIIDYNGQRLEILSKKKLTHDIHEFVIPEMQKKGQGTLQVVSLELVPETPDLTKLSSFRVKLFLEKLDSIQLSGKVNFPKPQMISHELHGSKLVLKLQAQEKLHSLTLLQKYELISQFKSVLFPNRPEERQVVGPKNISKKWIWLNFSQQNMVQSLEAGVLKIEIDLDQNAKIQSQVTYPIYAGPILVSQETQHHFVEGPRSIESIEVITESLQSLLPKNGKGAIKCRLIL